MKKMSSGFSLMEILVAFAILSISIGTLLSVFNQGLRTAATSRHYSEAAIIAESRLAEIGNVRELVESEEQGESGLYQWEVHIEEYVWPEADVDPIVEESSLTTMHIRIKIAWLQGSKPQFIEIESLQLKGK